MSVVAALSPAVSTMWRYFEKLLQDENYSDKNLKAALYMLVLGLEGDQEVAKELLALVEKHRPKLAETIAKEVRAFQEEERVREVALFFYLSGQED